MAHIELLGDLFRGSVQGCTSVWEMPKAPPLARLASGPFRRYFFKPGWPSVAPVGGPGLAAYCVSNQFCNLAGHGTPLAPSLFIGREWQFLPPRAAFEDPTKRSP